MSQTDAATIQIAQVSSEVCELAEQLADLRAAVEGARAKLEECSLRLSLIPPGSFELRVGSCGTSQASELSFAPQPYPIKERMHEAQRLAWKLRGRSARTPPNSAASESAHTGGLSVSSSLSRCEPMLSRAFGAGVPGTPGTPGISGIQGSAGIPALWQEVAHQEQAQQAPQDSHRGMLEV